MCLIDPRSPRHWLAPILLGLLACLPSPPVAWGQMPDARDQISDFRRLLKDAQPPDALLDKPGAKTRKDILQEAAKSLTSIGAIRQVLALQEWRDEDRDEVIASGDLTIRKSLGERLEAMLGDVLKEGRPLARIAACQLIGEMASQIRSLEPGNRTSYCRVFAAKLIRTAKDDNDPEVRASAARSLGRITPDPEEAVPALRDLLADADPSVARAAIDGLSNLIVGAFVSSRVQTTVIIEVDRKEQVAISKLAAPLLGDVLRTNPDPDARSSALKGLFTAADQLVELVPDPRRDSAAGIDRFDLSVEERQSLVPILQALAGQIDAAAQMTGVGSTVDRERAANYLAYIGLSRVKLLGRKNTFVPPTSSRPDTGGSVPPAEKPSPGNMSQKPTKPTRPAPVTLGRLRTVADLPADALAQADEKLPPPVKTPEEDRQILQSMLNQLPALAQGLNNPNRDVRVAILQSIESLGRDAGPAAPLLVQATRDPDIFVRWVAARASARIAPEHDDIIIPALIPLLADHDLDVRLVALAAIERFAEKGRPAVPELTRTSLRGDSEVRVVAVRVLEAVHPQPDEVVPTFIKGLDNPDRRVRLAVIGALERVGPPAAVALPALKSQLDDEDREVREAAADAILSIARIR